MALGNDDVVEMANLFSEDTGIEGGVIFISTAMASHGPRVEYSLKAGRHQPSFSVSIATEPRLLASSLPDRTVSRFGPAVIEWVKINREALLRFWNEGDSFSVNELKSFVTRLKKLPPG